MLSRFLFRIFNNRIVNQLLIATGLDSFMLSRFGMYKRVKPDITLSPQLMAGFSHAPDVEEALSKTHRDLQETAAKYIKPGGNVLDIGCGAGAYLIHFEKNYNATGIDLNTEMIIAGPKHVPSAKFIYADNTMRNWKSYENKVNGIGSESLLTLFSAISSCS